MRIALFLLLATYGHAASDYAGRFGYRFEQVEANQKYVAGGPGYRVTLSRKQVSLTLPSRQIHMTFEGAGRGTTLSAEDVLPGRTNHLEGADRAAWRTGASSYRAVRYREIYPGIDLLFYGSGKTLEYDYVLRPGADPGSIRMQISGAGNVRIDDAGDLILGTGAEDVRWKRPVIYQPGEHVRSVDGRFALDGRGLVRFEVGAYDHSRELVIDPVLAYSTYLGGTGNDAIRAMATDGAGNVFVAGITTSQTLPVSHAVQPAYGGNTTNLINGDAFVAKFSASGALVYMTYLGGSADDFASGIALDAAGNAWVAGGTNSLNFPVSAAGFQRTYGGAGGNGLMRMGDAFLAKIGPNGDALLYSTYLGGSLDDVGTAVALDGAGNVCVAGATRSRNFPVLQPLQAEFAGAGGEQEFPKYGVVPFDSGDVFIAKFAATTQALVYSTYLGGRQDDMPTSIAVDAAGSVYIAGFTLSTDFPTTAGAYQRVNRGSLDLTWNIFWNFGDGFVAKLNPAGNQLVYSTLLGGTGDDFISSIALDSTGAAYVTGATCSEDFPVTTGVYQRGFRGPLAAPVADVLIGDAFLAKLNPQGSGLAFSTYLGGSGDDAGTAVRLDALGNVYVAGFTNSSDFPVTTDGLQRTFGGGGQQNENQNYGDGFLALFDAAGAKVTYATFFGGLYDDEVMAMALDATGNVYLGGSTVSRNLTTKSAFQAVFGGSNSASRVKGDGFLTMISGFPTPPPVVTGPSVASVTNAASYSAGAVSPGMIFSLFGKGVGPDTIAGAALAANGTLATQVADTQILFDGAPAPLVFASAGQSSGIAPYSVAGKTSTQVVVVYKGQRSAAFPVQVVDALPGLFAANAQGSGQGAIFNQDGTPNSAANPAKRGDVVVLYGTGEGQTVPAGSDGLIATAVYPKPALTTTATVGSQTADIVYAGAVPFQVAGLFQINLRVPTNIGAGSQPVVVSFGPSKSQANLTVSVQ